MLAVTYGKRNIGIRLTAFVISSVFFVYKLNFRSFDSATAPAVRPLASMPHETSISNFPLIKIIDNSNSVDIKKMVNAVIIAYSTWSTYSITNYSDCVKLLNDRNYKGEIFQLNMNNVTEEFQLNTFNRLCEGWGEIFIIKQGNIIESFFGRDCLNDFRIKTEKKLLLE